MGEHLSVRRLISELSYSGRRVVAGYLAIAGLWIFASEALIASFAADLEQLGLLYTLRASGFALLSAVLLFLLVRQSATAMAQQRAVVASEARLRSLVASVADHAFYMLDNDGRIASWNTGAERLLGYAESEVLGSHFERFFDADDRAAGLPARLLRTAALDGRVATAGWRSRKDGTRFWADGTLSAVRNDDGELLGFAKTTRDLSAPREVNERLRTLDQQLAFTQLHGKIGFFEHDLITDRVEFSNRALEIYGWRREDTNDVLDRWLNLVHPADRARMGAEVERGLRTGGKFDLDFRIIRSDGEERSVYAVVVADHDDDGRPIRTHGMILDVSDRARARCDADAHRERLAAVVESTMDAIVTVDADQRIVEFNAAAEHVFRIRRQDTIGTALERFIPADARARHRQHFDRFSESGVTSRSMGQANRVRALRADGSEFPAEASITKVTVGAQRFYTAILRDVTAQEAARLQVEEGAARLRRMSLRVLQTQEQERRRLARELHDELGQVLTAAKLHLQRIAVERPEVLAIRADLDRALAQVRSISLNLRPSMIDDLGLVATLRWHLGQQSQLGGFVTELDAEALTQRPAADVESAAFRIVQEALTNVQRHARAKHVRVKVREAGTRLHLEIHDDGLGFDPRVLSGSGGLLGMRERAALLDGTFEIESAPGRGTTVRAELPMLIDPDEEART